MSSLSVITALLQCYVKKDFFRSFNASVYYFICIIKVKSNSYIPTYLRFPYYKTCRRSQNLRARSFWWLLLQERVRLFTTMFSIVALPHFSFVLFMRVQRKSICAPFSISSAVGESDKNFHCEFYIILPYFSTI